MFDNFRNRLLLILGLTLVSGWFLFQHRQETGEIVTLGLDLQGGSHLALEVADPDETLTAERKAALTEQALYIIRTRIDELGVAEPTIQRVGADRIIVELPGISDEGRAREIIQRSAFLEFQIVQPLAELDGVLPRMDRAIAQSLRIAGDTPAAEPSAGVGDLLQAAPGDEDEEAVPDSVAAARPFSSKLFPAGAGAEGEVPAQFAVTAADAEEIERYLALPEVQRLLPRGTEFIWGMDTAESEEQGFRTLYLVEERPIMTGEFLQDAQAQRDQLTGQPIVAFELNRRGGRVFGRATGEHVGDYMAIVLDERAVSAPVIQSQIESRGQITMGGGSIEEARDLALVLRAGALPAPIQVVEERTVGPSLGQDSIDRGAVAGIIGIVTVILIMLGYYRLAGLMAVAALGLYVLFVLGALSGLNATLTLPGIAGLILSIGMAVDANVLIFERIREEVAAGRGARTAVNEGFAHALSAIVDSQLTTLITAFVLFQFGTGPIRGFAVTLAIGLIASMFTALFVTRTFFMLYLDRRLATQGLSI